MQLPLYQCHKKVRAAQIKSHGAGPEGYGIVLENGAVVFVDEAWLTRNPKLAAGGYFVQYIENEDQYAAYSPALPFEQGYTLVPMSLEELDASLKETMQKLNAPTSHLDRVKVEKEDLDERILKLDEFTMSTTFLTLDSIEQDDLLEQLETMQAYSAILARRLNRA